MILCHCVGGTAIGTLFLFQSVGTWSGRLYIIFRKGQVINFKGSEADKTEMYNLSMLGNSVESNRL